jgi:hypothetical protein
VAGGLYDSSLTRVQPFSAGLIADDAAGASWFGKLLAATPHGRAVLGPGLLKERGTLSSPLTFLQPSGRLGCFECPVAPSRALLAWFVENPDKLVWPKSGRLSSETTRLRRALIDDEPAGSRAGVQQEARALVQTRSPGARGWWRFEGTSMLDCVLMTDQLVVTIEGKRREPLSHTTDWYPRRSQLVRNLEAAKQPPAADAGPSLLLCEKLVAGASDAELEAILPESAPHLDASERDELHRAYLGNMTWEQACLATGVEYRSLPETSRDPA